MKPNKRPKGFEVERYVHDLLRGHQESETSHGSAIRRILQLEKDLALLMAHLKLEFLDTPTVPAKRVVGKARKKKPIDCQSTGSATTIIPTTVSSAILGGFYWK